MVYADSWTRVNEEEEEEEGEAEESNDDTGDEEEESEEEEVVSAGGFGEEGEVDEEEGDANEGEAEERGGSDDEDEGENAEAEEETLDGVASVPGVVTVEDATEGSTGDTAEGCPSGAEDTAVLVAAAPGAAVTTEDTGMDAVVMNEGSGTATVVLDSATDVTAVET